MDECDELEPPLGYADRNRAIKVRTEGKPRSVVDMLIATQPGQHKGAFKAIEEALFKRFGSPSEIAAATRKKIASWKPIKASDDPEKIRDLADNCKSVSFTMSSVQELNDLNTSYGLDSVRQLLPIDMQRRWAVAGTQYKRRYDHHPTFAYFGEWLYEQADVANDPHFKIAYGSRDKDKKTQQDQKQAKSGKDPTPATRSLRTDSSTQPQAGQREAEGASKESGKKAGASQGGTQSSNKPGGNSAKKDEAKDGGSAPPPGSGEEPKKKCLYHGEGNHATKDCLVLAKLKDLAAKPEVRKELGIK